MKRLLLLCIALAPLRGVFAADPAWSSPSPEGIRKADLAQLPLPPGAQAAPYGAPFAPWTAWKIPKGAALPVPLPLPDGARTLGLWYKGAPGDRITFSLRTADGGSVDLRDGEEQGRPRKYRFDTYSPPGQIDGWTLRQVHLGNTPGPVRLTGIRVSGKSPGPVMIAGLHASSQGPSRAARWVWKVKDLDPAKPSSITWTAIAYYEYGWDRPALLRACGWKKMLGEGSLGSLEVEILTVGGDPLWRTTLTGRPLRQDIILPRLPEGTYFVDCTARDDAGGFLKTGRFVYQVLRDDDAGSALPTAPRLITLQSPGGGDLRLKIGEPSEATLACAPSTPAAERPRKAAWKLTAFDGAAIASGEAVFADDGTAPLTLRAPYEGAFQLEATLQDAQGRTLQPFTRLVATEPAPPPSHPAKMATDRGGVYSLSLMSTHSDPLLLPRLPTDTLPELVALTKKAGMTPGFIVKWDEFEPLPGVYQWKATDRLIDIARATGQAAWLGIGFTGDTLPEWLWFEELMDQDQMTIQASYHYVTPFGPRFTAAQGAMLRSLITHYRGDASVQGYLVYAGPSEGFLTDTPPSISDYSPSGRAAFRAYLQRVYGGNLAALDRQWKTSHASWDDVAPPQPDWGREWETSAAWLDFHRFKSDFVVARLSALARLAREADPDRPMMAYGKEGFGSTGRLARVFLENRFRYTNGGGETAGSYVQTCIMRNHGVEANPEGHYVMPNIGSVAMVAANSIWASRYEGQNIMWGLVWAKTPHVGVREYTSIARLGASLQAIEQELHQTRALQPWAGYFDGLQSMLQSRSFRTALYPEVSELMLAAGGRMHNLCSWVDDDSSVEAMQAYRVLVDSDSRVLASDALDRLLEYVRGGGTLVASTETALFLAGDDAPSHALARALGATGVTGGTDGSATAAHGLALQRLDTVAWAARPAPDPALRDDSGRPLLYSLPLGQGRVLLVCGRIDYSRSSSFLQKVIDETTGVANPYRWEGDDLTVRPLTAPGADYLPFVPWTPDRGLNHTLAELEKLPARSVTVSGLPPGLSEVTELLSGRKLPVVNGSVTGQFLPGMLHILKIPKPAAATATP